MLYFILILFYVIEKGDTRDWSYVGLLITKCAKGFFILLSVLWIIITVYTFNEKVYSFMDTKGYEDLIIVSFLFLMIIFLIIIFYFHIINPKRILRIKWLPTWLIIFLAISSIGSGVYGIVRSIEADERDTNVENLYETLDKFFGYEITIVFTRYTSNECGHGQNMVTPF